MKVLKLFPSAVTAEAAFRDMVRKYPEGQSDRTRRILTYPNPGGDEVWFWVAAQVGYLAGIQFGALEVHPMVDPADAQRAAAYIRTV